MATNCVVRLHESASGRCSSSKPACTVDSFGRSIAAVNAFIAIASSLAASGLEQLASSGLRDHQFSASIYIPARRAGEKFRTPL